MLLSPETKKRDGFSSTLAALMVALGSAVGLGNIWKFPYMTGTGGGGAFLLVYLFFVFMVAVPIMISEFVIGRRSRMNPVGAFRKLDKNPNSPWSGIGFMGALAAYLIMFFYSCVAGWVYYYTFKAATGAFVGITAEKAGAMFGSAIGAGTAGGSFFSAAVLSPIFWQVLVLCVIGAIISMGVSRGIEKAIRIMMPALFLLLIICVIRALTLPGAAEGLRFLFHVDFSQITPAVILGAMGLAFFKLSLGMGTMITYGSYFTDDSDLSTAPLKIAIADICVSMLAGLAIFPTVFSFGVAPGAGPGLLFITIPLVFSQMPFGQVLLFAFFLLTAFAANGAMLSLVEVPTVWMSEEFNMPRKKAAILNCVIIAAVGVLAAGSADSSSFFGGITVMGKGFFDLFDFISSNICLPLGGLFIALYAGYKMKEKDLRDELTNHGKLHNEGKVKLIRFLLRYVTPLLVLIIFLNSLGLLNF
ncbi:MAG: sodium-dependent transporter [Synergistaceae bacterium]|nr:sodium-dependent transporter [Synergistaceae bacterium]